jgi:hypothetical protein
VPLALVFAQEHGAGLEAPRVIGSRLVAPCEAIEMLCGLWIKPTLGLLLDMPAEKPRHEVLGEGRRRVPHIAVWNDRDGVPLALSRSIRALQCS